MTAGNCCGRNSHMLKFLLGLYIGLAFGLMGGLLVKVSIAHAQQTVGVSAVVERSADKVPCY